MSTVTSDIVVFSDANTFLKTDAIRALVRNFADEDVGVVSADVALTGYRAALARSEDLYYRYERWIQKAESDIGSTIGADGALYAIRRELFRASAGRHDSRRPRHSDGRDQGRAPRRLRERRAGV